MNELAILKNWVDRAEHAGLFGGYPIGDAYADPRLEPVYYRIASEYAAFDSFVAKKLPHMQGKYLCQVLNRIRELELTI